MAPSFLDELNEQLRCADDETRPDRLERAIFLMRQGQPEQGWLFFGGGVVVPWHEMTTAYMAGCYQAALLIGQTCLENLLGAALEFPDKKVGLVGLARLLDLASSAGLLLEPEFREFDKLRRRRNPYAHYRPYDHPENATQQLMARKLPYEELAREDCERFIEVLFDFVHRRFGVGAVIIPEGLDEAELVHPDQLELGGVPAN